MERFLKEVCIRLPVQAPEHHYVFFCSAKAVASGLFPAGVNIKLVTLPFANPLIERALILPWLVRRHRLDALLVQRLAPWVTGRCRLVLAVHDITPIKFPQQYKGLTNILVRLLTASSVRRSSAVLTPSRTIAHEVAEYSGEPAEKFNAYYNGVDTSLFFPARRTSTPASIDARLSRQASFILVSGALERRKNVETAIRALKRIPVELCKGLIVVGGVRDATYLQELRAIAGEPGLEERVRLIGFVSDSELADLYRTAVAFVSASRDEGFNMPVLEAMASGVPTLCSDIPVHRELFADATVYFSADDDAALAAQLSRVLLDADFRECLRQSGVKRAKHFTWDAAAQRVGAVLTRT